MFLLKEIKKALPDAKFIGPQPSHLQEISTDSRTINSGDLFIPLKGSNFDGRKFIKTALKKGATVLDTKSGLKNYQAIAAAHRHRFNLPVIAVTGSCGKTTTKDILAAILAQKYRTLKNVENFNNEIGVPKTLLQLRAQHQAAVVELAMQGLGEISQIAKITAPQIALITNVGEAHLKQLKSKNNIARAKSEVIDHLPRGGYIILNADDAYYKYFLQRTLERSNLLCCGKKSDCGCDTARCGINVISFGINNKALISPQNPAIAKLLKSLPLPGKHNVYNALAAIAAAKTLGLSDRQIAAGIKSVETSKHRMKIIKCGNATIIDDTYNANPSSMKAALEMLKAVGQVSQTMNHKPLPSARPLRTSRRIAVLGDMLELGSHSKKYHQEIGELAAKLGIDILVGVGTLAKNYTIAAQKIGANKNSQIVCKWYPNVAAAGGGIKKILQRGDIVLVKGSRGMRMEKIIQKLSGFQAKNRAIPL